MAIAGERIAAVEPGLRRRVGPGTRIVDAAGRYVMPGAVDMHVHFALPVRGLVSSDDFATGTRAAAMGGVTSIIDFVTPVGDQTLRQAFKARRAEAEGNVAVDFGFHMVLTDGKKHIPQVPKVVELGIPTFKQFMTYGKQGWQATDADLFAALEKTRQVGGTLLLHAESGDVLDLLIERKHNRADLQRYGARLHPMTRPNFIEAEAIQRAITWAEVTGGQLHIVHMSTGQGAALVRDARNRRVRVTSETCPQYLVLTDEVFARKDGHLFATSPQVKSAADQSRLWKGLKNGEVDIVCTDTCTFTRKQKARWGGDWTKLPMGMPGVETMVPIMVTHGVQTRRLPWSKLVATCCTNPARLMGLYPRKGILRPGSDADVVVIDPGRKVKVDHRKLATNCDWSPYQGWELAGFAEHTFSRGRQIVRGYRFVGDHTWGRYLARSAARPW